MVDEEDDVDDVRDEYDGWVAATDPALVVVTMARDGERSGCLVGFHTQVSIEPRRHLVGVSRSNHTFGLAVEATHVGMHLVGADQHDLAALFGGETGDEVDKFERWASTPGPGDVPILAGVTRWFVGRVVGRQDCGDHLGLLLEPVAASASATGEGDPGVLRMAAVEDVEPGHPA